MLNWWSFVLFFLLLFVFFSVLEITISVLGLFFGLLCALVVCWEKFRFLRWVIFSCFFYIICVTNVWVYIVGCPCFLVLLSLVCFVLCNVRLFLLFFGVGFDCRCFYFFCPPGLGFKLSYCRVVLFLCLPDCCLWNFDSSLIICDFIVGGFG